MVSFYLRFAKPRSILCVVFIHLMLFLMARPDTCQRYEINKIGVRGRSLKHYTFSHRENVDILSCMKECVKKTVCKSINYNMIHKICELNSANSTKDYDNLSAEEGSMYIASTNIPKDFAGACANISCPLYYTCYVTDTIAIGCRMTECPSPIQCGVMISTFNTIQRVGTTISYEDVSGSHIANLTCDRNGFWSVAHIKQGNLYLNQLTSQDSYQLRIDLEDFEGEKRYASYEYFRIDNASTNYRLNVTGYSGDAGDSFSYHSGFGFTTFDSDLNRCALRYKGGWWYNLCHLSNLNGLYLRGIHDTFADGVEWYFWKGKEKSEMKIRKNK